MTAMQLFLALEGVEDRFVLEAEQPPKPALWKPIAVAAAALLVVLGTVWAARTILEPPQPPALAQETIAPAQTTLPQTTPSETAAPPAADQTIDVSQPEETAEDSEAIWPAKIGATYQHTDAGDFLTFMEVPTCGRPTETIEITGQLEDGYCTGQYYYSVPGSTVTYELQVHPDGSYDISVRTDYLSWTNHDPPWPPEDCEPDAVGIPLDP